MGKTVPNQKSIIIHKKKYIKNFLQVGIDEIQEVVKKYNKSTVALYLYLCANADGYNLALSQVAVENAYGIKKTAYYDAIDNLIKDGYLVKESGNTYGFYTTPLSAKTETSGAIKQEIPLLRKSLSAKTEQNFRKTDIEIDNKYNKQIEGVANTLSAPNGASSRVIHSTAALPGGEEVREITAAQLEMVCSKEDLGNGLFRINGRLFSLKLS